MQAKHNVAYQILLWKFEKHISFELIKESLSGVLWKCFSAAFAATVTCCWFPKNKVVEYAWVPSSRRPTWLQQQLQQFHLSIDHHHLYTRSAILTVLKGDSKVDGGYLVYHWTTHLLLYDRISHSLTVPSVDDKNKR